MLQGKLCVIKLGLMQTNEVTCWQPLTLVDSKRAELILIIVWHVS